MLLLLLLRSWLTQSVVNSPWVSHPPLPVVVLSTFPPQVSFIPSVCVLTSVSDGGVCPLRCALAHPSLLSLLCVCFTYPCDGPPCTPSVAPCRRTAAVAVIVPREVVLFTSCANLVALLLPCSRMEESDSLTGAGHSFMFGHPCADCTCMRMPWDCVAASALLALGAEAGLLRRGFAPKFTPKLPPVVR